jgi:hypothetical protein
MSKTVLQKSYEKLFMLEQNSDKLFLIGAKNTNGRPLLVLAILEGETVTPIAEMLTQNQLDSIEPNWEYTDKLVKIIEGAKAIEDRISIDAFQEQHTEIDEYFEKADY